jgi:toxic protein SymE
VKKSRNLKIYPKIRVRTWDRIIVPEIRLQGIWLKELGFEHGKQIKVEKHKDKLVITLEENEN